MLELIYNNGKNRKIINIEYFRIASNFLYIVRKNKHIEEINLKRAYLIRVNKRIIWSNVHGTNEYKTNYDSRVQRVNKKRSKSYTTVLNGIKTIDGWLFQKTNDDNIILIRVSKIGEWFLDIDNINPLGTCIYTIKIASNKWRIILYDLEEGKTIHVIITGKKKTILEMFRIARVQDEFDKDYEKNKYLFD